MKPEIPPYVSGLIRQLNDHGYECYVVGGAVRSALLNLPVHDYDLTTNAVPAQMKQVFSSYHTIDTGLKHGTLTVMADHHPVEITTYRRDSVYTDHRHPDAVAFSSALKEDCARRDFTINAMCYHPDEGILDFFGGKEDLEAGIIRCIGDPYKRFGEDALRLLRALRFAARLSFVIETKTAEAIHELRDTLTYVSAERIREEFNGILEAPGCAEQLQVFSDLVTVFMPEIRDLDEAEWNTLLMRMKKSPDSTTVRLALFLDTLKADHAVIMRRLKYSNAEIRTVTTLLKCADMPLDTRIDMRCLLNKLECPYELYRDFRSSRDPSFDAASAAEYYRQIREDHDCCRLEDLAVNGNDMKQLGFTGRQIRENLELCLDLVIHEKLANRKEDVIRFLSDKRSAVPSPGCTPGRTE